MAGCRMFRRGAIGLGCFALVNSGLGALLPFPLSAGQRGIVVCLENPAISYDIFLPPAYSTNGAPLPIIYTMAPGGAGMVGAFQSVCSSLNIITVGILGPRNSNLGAPLYKEAFAITRDIRRRVLFDPTAEFAGGSSGGGLYSYRFSRFRSQHVTGVIEMAGWLGVSNISTYRSTDQVQTNLLVARTTGLSDTGALLFNSLDGAFLTSCGAVINDWFFNGGHTPAPDSVKTLCFNWLLAQRVMPGPDDRSNSEILGESWRTRLASGERASVLRDCVAVLMNRPRTWDAFQAQLVLDDLEADFASFRSLEIENLAQGEFASDMFYYSAMGAADSGDMERYRSCMRAMTGITDCIGHQTTNIHNLLVKYGFPTPVVQSTHDLQNGLINCFVRKDTTGLDYALEFRSRLAEGAWEPVSGTFSETNTTWSALCELNGANGSGFYRVKTVPK